MTETKWTPGPWGYRTQEYDDWGLVRGPPDAEGRRWPVAQARFGRHVSEDEKNEHRRNDTDPCGPNARLIAAAPEMFEAAEAALDCLRHAHDVLLDNSGYDTLRHSIIAECRSLVSILAKARGEP